MKKTNNVYSFGCIIYLLILCPCLSSVSADEYPTKPITIYCGNPPGGSVDVSARALAKRMEELAGVSVIVENKPGGNTTVCAGLVANKKPDGYFLGVINEGALNVVPHLQNLAYDPLKDFTILAQYARNLGVLVVRKDSPFNTIHELITHAKTHPGQLAYLSIGMYSRTHLAIELLSQCKGLSFKHVPTKGATDASTMLMGGHADFSVGASQIVYVQQGVFRLLMVLCAETRNPLYPDVPIMKDIGCPDIPPPALLMIGPKGLPRPISEKLGRMIKKITEEPSFQKALQNIYLSYEFLDQEQMEKRIPTDYEWFKNFLKKIGAKKK